MRINIGKWNKMVNERIRAVEYDAENNAIVFEEFPVAEARLIKQYHRCSFVNAVKDNEYIYLKKYKIKNGIIK